MVASGMDLRDNKGRGSQDSDPWNAWSPEKQTRRTRPLLIILLFLGLAGFLAYRYISKSDTPPPSPAWIAINSSAPCSRALAMDLDGGGITIVSSASSSALFDVDKDGDLERCSWIKPGDAFLATDHNANLMVDDISELYTSGLLATEPYLTPLARADSNGDSIIDGRDHGFDQVLVWRDLNGDGASSEGEIATLAQSGVTSIALWPNGVPSCFFREDGSNGTLRDIFLTYSELPPGQAPVNRPSDAPLPQLMGQGSVPDLDQAMALNPELERMVRAMTRMRHGHELYDAMDDFLETWASVDQRGPPHAGGPVDHRKLAVVEAFLGPVAIQDYSAESANVVHETYGVLKDTEFTALALQTIYTSVFDRIQWIPEEDRCEVLVPQEELPGYLADIANDIYPEELPFINVILRTLAPHTHVSVESLTPLLDDPVQIYLTVDPTHPLLRSGLH